MNCMYLDFIRDFHKVSHRRLLQKLEYLVGVKGKLLEWMIDFIHERQMNTVTRGKKNLCTADYVYYFCQ